MNMKTTIFNAPILAFAVGLLFSACNDNSENPSTSGNVPEEVVEAFSNQYTRAQDVTWTTKNGYAIAKFKETPEANSSSSAWYELKSARWSMTDTDIPYTHLPAAVKTAFEAGVYGKQPWVHDDEVDVLTRNNVETLYVIDAEKEENGTETDVELTYTEEGVLVKESIDNNDDDHEGFLPQPVEGSIEQWLSQNFPNAKIIDIDREDNVTEVEFVNDGLPHEALFSTSNSWVRTKTTYEGRNLKLVPAEILSAASQLRPGMTVEEISRYVSAKNGTYYTVELEDVFDRDAKIYVDEKGTEIDAPTADDGENNTVLLTSEVKDFLNQKYPNATILEKESVRGYTVVDIRHEGTEKEVRFNGKHEWVDTQWEVPYAQLNDAIRKAVSSQYAGYEVDDEAEAVETSNGVLYLIELEGQNDNEIQVTFDSTGKVVSEKKA